MTTNSHGNAMDATSPEQIIAAVLAAHPGEPACLTCSFQIEDMLVLDLLRAHQPGIPVLFLETGYHFPETYAYRDRMTALWHLNLVNVMPDYTVAEQEAEHGRLYRTDSKRCCQLRKVDPLMRALRPYRTWFTGLRRVQSPSRRNLAVSEIHVLPTGESLRKISPLALWDDKELWRAAHARGIEALPLYAQGYTSIGCAPCTAIPAAGADPRSGRWGGDHLECGIHTATVARGSELGAASPPRDPGNGAPE